MQLIVFSGLPCTGKSSVAEGVGQALDIPVFAKDWLEATLIRCGWDRSGDNMPDMGYTSYQLLTTLAERQLTLGQSVILDSVAGLESTRAQWRNLAQTRGAAWRVIECVCSDEAQHRIRLQTRQRNIPDWPELTWAEVERVKAYFEPWQDDRLVLDMIDPLSHNIQLALDYLQTV